MGPPSSGGRQVRILRRDERPAIPSSDSYPLLPSGGTREKDDEIKNHNRQKREDQRGCGEEGALHGIVDEISPPMKPMPRIPKHGKPSFAIRAFDFQLHSTAGGVQSGPFGTEPGPPEDLKGRLAYDVRFAWLDLSASDFQQEGRRTEQVAGGAGPHGISPATRGQSSFVPCSVEKNVRFFATPLASSYSKGEEVETSIFIVGEGNICRIRSPRCNETRHSLNSPANS